MKKLKKENDLNQTISRKKIIIAIGILATLLLVTGTTLAFYLAKVVGDGKKAQASISKLDIIFTDTPDVNPELLAPIYDNTKGTKAYKNTFTIENSSSNGSKLDAEYNVYLNIASIDSELKSEYMKYELLKNGQVIATGNLADVPTETDIQLTQAKQLIELDAGVQSLEFRLWMSYHETANQISMLNKSMTAKLKIKANDVYNPRATKVIIEKAAEENTEGLIIVEQPATVQTPATMEYRYSGSNNAVKNYVKFNNETWRIIGVFEVDNGNGIYERRMKIIRDKSIGTYSWDSSASTVNPEGKGVNQWGASGTYEGADLMRLLNSGYTGINGSLYYNSQSGTCYSGVANETKACDFTATTESTSTTEIGLKAEARKMIADAKWYTGATEFNFNVSTYANSADAYKEERSNKVGPADTGITIAKTPNWVGKVGLMYASDYGYASTCYANTLLYKSDGDDIRKCKNENWLSTNTYKWTITPSQALAYSVRFIMPDGYVGDAPGGNKIVEVWPTVYLSTNIKIKDGTGTSDDPYILSL